MDFTMSNENGPACKFQVRNEGYNQYTKYEDCPDANDIDLSALRKEARATDIWEDNGTGMPMAEVIALSGGKKPEPLGPIAFAAPANPTDECLWDKRNKYPMTSNEEEIDDLAVLSGVRHRDPEERYLEQLEKKLDSLTGEIRSTVRIMKDLMRERRNRKLHA